MADPIYVQQGKLVSDSSLIPYIRKQDVHFDADNLRPRRDARLFFDDLAVNRFCQRGNKILVNTRKSIVISPNTGATIVTGLIAWQGTEFSSNTFRGIVQTYTSGTKTLVVSDLSGSFDDEADLYVSVTSGLTLNATCNITSHRPINSADTFSPGEGVYCQNNNVYMTVIGTSGENILYVNQNYLYCKAEVAAGSLTEAGFQKGDLVVQTSSGTRDYDFATFVGVVELLKTSASSNTLSITPISGKLNVNTSVSNTFSRLYNFSNTASPNTQIVSLVVGDIVANNVLKSTSCTSVSLNVTSYTHYSGQISNVEATGATVRISSSNTAHLKDRIFYVTSGTGIGTTRRVISVAGNLLTLNSALTVAPTIHTKYSIGSHATDENGSISGIFNIPEERNMKFKTGERIFTIMDASKVDMTTYTMKASAKFTAGGLLNTTQRITATPTNMPLPEFQSENPVAPINPTQRTYDATTTSSVAGSTSADIPRIPIADGLSQTFFTPKPTSNKPNRGIFITSVDLFFRNKPSVAKGHTQLPVVVKIATVSNGYPTKNYIARARVHAKDVNSCRPPKLVPNVNNSDTITKFRFKDPVYLEPSTEYALIVSSESPEYELWIAELGGDVLGASPPRRISEQPYAGLLFKSQNATTWTPYQNQDLMFVINKAVFNTVGGSVFFKMDKSPRANLDVGKLVLHTNDLAFSSAFVDYSVRGLKKNTITNGVSAESTYVDIKPHGFLRYGDYQDESSRTDPTSGVRNSRFVQRGNAHSLIVRADMYTTDPDISPVINRESISLAAFQYNINNAGLANTDISINVRGDGYTSIHTTGNIIYGSSDATKNNAAQLYRERYLANNYNVAFYNITVSSTIGSSADGFAVANTDGANSVDYIVLTNSGSGYYDTPTIAISAPNSSLEEDAAAVIFGETGKEGGNIEAKYITREITLVDGFACGDIRVFMSAIKPTGTDIQVYYKVLGVDDPGKLSDHSWVRMQRKQDLVSKSIKELIELQYAPNFDTNALEYTENGILYPIGGKFKSFAIKVCLTSVDTALVPFLRNLRVSAVPRG
jgi:hypothetical protein